MRINKRHREKQTQPTCHSKQLDSGLNQFGIFSGGRLLHFSRNSISFSSETHVLCIGFAFRLFNGGM